LDGLNTWSVTDGCSSLADKVHILNGEMPVTSDAVNVCIAPWVWVPTLPAMRSSLGICCYWSDYYRPRSAIARSERDAEVIDAAQTRYDWAAFGISPDLIFRDVGKQGL